MAYDARKRTSYHFAAIDFGAGLVSRVIAVPLDGISTASPGVGRRGSVAGATVHNVTEDFAGTDAGIQVGDGTDVDVYFDSGTVLDATVDTGESVYLLDDGSKIDIEAGRTNITVTFADAVTTGIADVTLDIDWD